jgi:two-component system, chemotaxis family, sensor kinase CheA
MEVKAEYLAIFAEEASDQLKEWEECLLALEKDGGDREHLNSLFRAVHTLKGSAGFIGFDALQKLAHDLESSLSVVRDGSRQYDGALGDLLFKGLDLCKSMIEAFTNGGTPQEDVEGFLAQLARLVENGGAKTAVPAAAAVAPRASAPAAAAAPRPAAPSAPAETPAAAPAGACPLSTCKLSVTIEGQAREAYLRSFIVKARLDKVGTVLAMDPAPEVLRDSEGPFAYTVTLETDKSPQSVPSEFSIDQVTVTLAKEKEKATPEQARSEETESAAVVKDVHEQFSHGGKADEVVRVSVQKLDTLLNLVGELVIYNSGFVVTTQQLREQYGKTRFIYDLEEKTEALSAITRELQDGIMKARMLPIANVFNRFRRVVRDLAKASAKSIVLDVFGEETEIDKKVIDRIGEPLVHLVRNAVDHGLETTADRVAAGKSPEGRIRLGAYQEGDHICIEVSDDGKGLDRDAILRKALEKGLIDQEDVASAGTEKILGFIFLPGFSTARKVSDISGRGVGMDAVKRAVDEMNGSLRVHSSPGEGTMVTITLPLTMAIISAVLVEVGGSTFAVPLSAVREVVKTTGAILKSVGTRRVILLRDEVLPLVNLGSVLKDGQKQAGAASASSSTLGLPVIVVDFDGKKIGLEVEKIEGTREVVIKSLSRHYREVDGLIGASILGNGKIALIVDVETLINVHHHNGNGRGTLGDMGMIDATGGGMSRRPQAAVPTAGKSVPDESPLPREEQPVSAPSAAPTPPTAAAAVPAVQPSGRSMDELARLISGSKGRLLEDVHNNGAIQASLSLSQFTGQEIRVSFPESRLVPIKDVADQLGGEENAVGGIYVGVKGDLTGGLLLVLPEANLLSMDDLLHGRPEGTTRDPSGLDISALSEMGNILACCFINAMADSDRLNVTADVPEISIDMCLSVVDSVLARFNQPGDKILLTEAVIYGKGLEDVVCHQILFLEPDSLLRLMDALARDAAASMAG